MPRRNTITLIIILVIFAFSLWTLLPIDGERFGRQGIKLGLDLKGGIRLVYQADLSGIQAGKQGEAINDAIAVIQKRINALGVAEPRIEKLGEDRISVELPSISDFERAETLIGQTALLEFGEQASESETAKWTNVLGNWKPASGIINAQQKELTSAYFKENTYVTRDSLGKILLIFEWNDEGSQLSGQITERLIGKPLGIFLGGDPLFGDDGRPIAPTIQSRITERGQIEGLSLREATELSRLLNAGRIPIPLTNIYKGTVSHELGANFIDMSLMAGLIGTLLVMLFMIAYYRVPGFLACLSLVFYGTFVLALFKLIPVTLTLAGLGGFIVSVGMAVDANVLIFERMKEEFRTGKTLGAAIEAGFDRAWTAIRDSNLTTIIACIILYWVGSSVIAGAQVQGFALTLGIGILTSMFTAITVSRTLLRLFIGSNLASRISLFTPYLGRKQHNA
ncbi:MAG: protein translocase subunit SecD [Chloroflexi bacterium]|nr:protein translocase subunit SecD [Chloroflexota bacterium]